MALAQDEDTRTRLYSMSAQIEADRSGYYQALQAAQRGDGDLTDWVMWFSRTLLAAIEAAETRLDHVLARSRFWQQHGGVAASRKSSGA